MKPVALRGLLAALAVMPVSLAHAEPDEDDGARDVVVVHPADAATEVPAPRMPDEPAPLRLADGLRLPNDGRRGVRLLLPRRTETLRVASPRAARPLSGGYDFGPRLAAAMEGTALDLRLGFDRGAVAQAAPPSELKYQWQLRHPLLADLDVGLLGSGEMGPWSQLRPPGEQINRYGLAVFGLNRADGGGLGWQASVQGGSAFGQGLQVNGSVRYGF